jgi:hypothetical protein
LDEKGLCKERFVLKHCPKMEKRKDKDTPPHSPRYRANHHEVAEWDAMRDGTYKKFR